MSVSFIVGIVILFWLYSIYTSLIHKRNKTQEAFSSIDVQLKKRYDLIPNILTIAQKYMDHERSLIEEITKLRTQAIQLPNNASSVDEKIALENQLSKKMNQFMVAVENYPEVKANETMVIAMQTYNEVEEHISAARRFYNSAALELKNAVEIFPSSLFARLMNIEYTDFFEANEVERKSVNASDYLK